MSKFQENEHTPESSQNPLQLNKRPICSEIYTFHFPLNFVSRNVTNAANQAQGCARFPENLQNFSERQILWSLCSVVFHVLMPIQTSLSVAPKLPVSLSSAENCHKFRKTSTSQGCARFLEFLIIFPWIQRNWEFRCQENVNSKISFASSHSFHLSSFFMYCQFTTLWWWFV